MALDHYLAKHNTVEPPIRTLQERDNLSAVHQEDNLSTKDIQVSCRCMSNLNNIVGEKMNGATYE